MTSIEIINAALALVGSKPAAVLDNGTPVSLIVNALYPGLKAALLEDREWTFNKRRLQLTKDANVPAFGYAFQYILPSTVLRIYRCYNGSAAAFGSPPLLTDWVREGFKILTNSDNPVYAEIGEMVDESVFSPGAVLALEHLCAGEFAIPLTENAKLSDMHWKLFETLIVSAGANDGSQGISQRLRPPPLPGRIQNL